MKKQDLIINEIKKKLGTPVVELKYNSAWQLLVAVVLSAQSTDITVNKITSKLFTKYPDIKDYLELKRSELEEIIYSSGFYKNKAKNILNAAKYICEYHNCEVPDTMEALVKVPGVGRKSANVILSDFFNKSEGIVVDTHVKRVANRLGLTSSSNPVIIERDLMNFFDKSDWNFISIGMVLFGRYVCKSKKPLCDECGLKEICLYYKDKEKIN